MKNIKAYKNIIQLWGHWWQIVCCLLGLSTTALSQPPIELHQHFKVQRLHHGAAAFMSDPSGVLSLAQVSSPSFQSRFRPLNRPFLPPHFPKEKFWIRFRLQVNHQKAFLLTLVPLVGLTEVYYKHVTDSNWQYVSTSLQAYQQQPHYASVLDQLPLKLPKTGTYECYLVSSNVRMPAVYSKKYFETTDAPQNLGLQALCLGSLGIILFYNLCLFLATRISLYFYYVLYLISGILLMLHLSHGLLAFGIFYDFSWMPFSFLHLPVFIFLFFIVLFSYKFLAVKHMLGRVWHWVYLLLGAGILMAMGLLPFFSLKQAYQWATLLAIFSILTLSISGLWAWIGMKHKHARFFVTAFSLYLLGGVLQVASHEGLLPSHILLNNVALLGAVLEAAFFSFALADRLNTLRREKNRAQAENLQLVQEQKLRLETEVQERTRDLRFANEILNQNNQQIQEQKDQLASSHQTMSKQKDELAEALKELQQLSTFKQQMVQMIAHDLKNPLQAVIGLSESKEAHTDLQTIHQSGKRMLHLVKNMLDVQKLQKKQFRLNKTTQNLASLGAEAIAQVHWLSQHKGLRINQEISESITVIADQELLLRVLVNLLQNALYHTPASGKVSLYYQYLPVNQVKITVEDTGIGIAADAIPHIFDDYYQHTNHKGGTGLGLTFCKLAVEAHGGTIGVESQPDKRTVVWLQLPHAKLNFQEMLAQKKQKKAKEKKGKLSNEDKEYLADYLQQLEILPVYQFTKIKSVLEQMILTENLHLKLWKKELMHAVNSSDQQRYDALVQGQGIE